MSTDYNRNILDIFRIIATMQVFLGHIVTHFDVTDSIVINTIYFVRGVPILFVLCGFLAAKSVETCNAKEWLINRFVRILPAFWMAIIINSIIILLVYNVKPNLTEATLYVVTQFFGMNFYTGGWLRGYGCGVPNGVLWTIPVQIQFFVLVPFLHKVLKNCKIKPSLYLVGGLTLFSIALSNTESFLPTIVNKLIGVTVVPYLYFLILGMVAWYHREKVIYFAKNNRIVILLMYVMWKLLEINFGFTHYFDGVLYNTVTTILLALLVFGFGFCNNWHMKKDFTYGFYLYHMIFVNIIIHLGYNSFSSLFRGIVLVCVIFIVTCIFASMSLNYVEIPSKKVFKERIRNGCSN